MIREMSVPTYKRTGPDQSDFAQLQHEQLFGYWKLVEVLQSCSKASVRQGRPSGPVSYTHLRAHETPEHLVCRLLLEKKKTNTRNHYKYTSTSANISPLLP
eukprot:TRINITY_DN62753_c0_g1_i1.p1 TRINITY_DN62753_c0_g1~~TRINITY_DN62753_c0_g1_i1.p1  ORF type:complete len:101 (-),score=3.42 TRINITY_DN62753_c0_g1_i1:55-357(-)